MKHFNINILILCIISTLVVSCGNDNSNEPEPPKAIFSVIPYLSQDSIHHYVISDDVLYKMESRGDLNSLSSNDDRVVWSQELKLDDTTINVGYGETTVITHDRSIIIGDTENYVAVIDFFSYKTSGNFASKKTIRFFDTNSHSLVKTIESETNDSYKLLPWKPNMGLLVTQHNESSLLDERANVLYTHNKLWLSLFTNPNFLQLDQHWFVSFDNKTKSGKVLFSTVDDINNRSFDLALFFKEKLNLEKDPKVTVDFTDFKTVMVDEYNSDLRLFMTCNLILFDGTRRTEKVYFSKGHNMLFLE